MKKVPKQEHLAQNLVIKESKALRVKNLRIRLLIQIMMKWKNSLSTILSSDLKLITKMTILQLSDHPPWICLYGNN